MDLTDDERARLTAEELRVAAELAAGRSVAVNVRRGGPHRRLVPLLVERGLLTYVGHAGSRHSWPRSDFANPFRRYPDNRREEMVERYAQWLEERPDLLERIAAGELSGRALGCWCVPALPCHAEVVARLANEAGRVRDR
jgi:hypothetical protein